MKYYDKITPEGTRDVLFEECEARRAVQLRLRELFTGCGYSEVITPAIEFYDVFTHDAGSFPQESMYKLTDAKGRLLVLRPDVTTPIARLVGTRLKGAPLPLRLYYDQDIYRVSPELTGRRDEIGQVGVELIGSSSVTADLEMLTLAAQALQAVDAPGYRIELGHIGFFRALVRAAGMEEAAAEQIRQDIEGKNYPALDRALDRLPDQPAVRTLRALPRLFGGEEVFAQARSLFSDADALEALDYLRRIYDCLCRLGLSEHIMVDLGLVNRNEYYTGVMFRGYIRGTGEEVLSGGRYDDLIADFGAPLPAIGLALGVDLLAKQCAGLQPAAPERVLLVCTPGQFERAVERSQQLRAAGVVCEYFHGSYEEACQRAAGMPNTRAEALDAPAEREGED